MQDKLSILMLILAITWSGSGVFWPTEGEPTAELAKTSDHHLVWLDVEF